MPVEEVAREIKRQREREFKNKDEGYEQGMRQCPDCKQCGFFLHDGPTKRCRHAQHNEIVEAAATGT